MATYRVPIGSYVAWTSPGARDGLIAMINTTLVTSPFFTLEEGQTLIGVWLNTPSEKELREAVEKVRHSLLPKS